MIYEDAFIKIEQPQRGPTQGSLVIEPQQSCQYLSDLEPKAREQFVTAANYAATVLFETLKAQGTNIIINEEPLRCMVIARSEEDQWSHQWTPVSVEQQAMDEAAENINFAVPLEGQEEQMPEQPQAPPPEPERPNEEREKEIEEKENYLIRQLYRVP